MKPVIKLFLCLFLLSAVCACRKPYNPTVTTTDYAYLVVEGVVNSGADSTSITLSRTVPIGASSTHRPETGARVVVESTQNQQYQLTEISPGVYVNPGLNLPAGQQYRLHIFNASGREYMSDFVESKITPPIDTITRTFLPHGVQFYVNTHDPNNNTHYYRWEYHEYWSYNSEYPTVLQYSNGAVIGLPVDSDYNHCYRNATPANGIFLGSSARLSQDIINQQPLNYVEGQGGKLVGEYALQVVQFAVTPEAYSYWQQLKTNTEQLGSIFDVQPSELPSNIHCVTNPTEPVIGYLSVSTSTMKRTFLTNAEVPFAVQPVIGPLADTLTCSGGVILFVPDSTLSDRLRLLMGNGEFDPYGFSYDPTTLKPNGYQYARSPCVDCRLDGGTNHKPSWWPWTY